ncbi:nuclease-related domain-containing protein [Ammoniphilus sp. YIM 78166]|uniref:nuclease-related domain-containing protein n=1 Tax=Ammoniphilus sp. YIM 78166 TaxID=1644106 RepID=UPI00106FD5D7|nr:nuclease-related domain-containing protein [Ammoniphilus sp. YIM 78166]
MIKKARHTRLIIQMEETLLRRLPNNHPKRPDILKSLERNWKGYRGEQSLDYYLKFLPERDYLHFQDLAIPYQDTSFQLDSLLLTPSLAIIIESKNFHGTLIFDERSGQFLRENDQQQKEGYSNPIQQAKRHKYLLEKWLLEQNVKSFPIRYLVSISKPTTIIKTEPDSSKMYDIVVHAERVPDKIKEIEAKYPQKVLSSYLLNRLSHLLIEAHVPTDSDTNILQTYGINPSEILIGVKCPQCGEYSMIRKHGTWACPKCIAEDKKAHAQAIYEYLLLYHTITNRQCRDFLQLVSENTAKRLLTQMNLPYKGATSNRTYHRPTDLDIFK